MGILENIRKWIDGVSEVTIPEPKPKYPAEEFLVKISREIDVVMKREMWREPQGATRLPWRFVVIVNKEDGNNWAGPKRKAFEQTLINIMSERARELSGTHPLAVKTFDVEMREDDALGEGEIKVEPIWEDPKSEPLTVTSQPSESQPKETIVHVPTTEIFTVEVWRGGATIAKFPFAKSEITIGRGSQATPVDLPINGYQEVSRLHAVLKMDEDAKTFWITAKGRNPTLVAGKKIAVNEPSPITPKDEIEISTFTLRVRPATEK